MVFYIKKIIRIILRVLSISFFLLSAFILFLVYQSKGDVEKGPSFFGYKPLTILSNSMQPAFRAGDVIIINTALVPKENDIITFKRPDKMLVTHRIVGVKSNKEGVLFQTKGDFNNNEDELLITEEEILGVQTLVIPYAGYAAKFVSGPIGFFMLVAMPVVLFLTLEIFQRLGLIGREKKVEI